MVDDWEIEDRCSYYCLSEIDRNLVNFIDERKMKSYENVNKWVDRVGKKHKRCRM